MYMGFLTEYCFCNISSFNRHISNGTKTQIRIPYFFALMVSCIFSMYIPKKNFHFLLSAGEGHQIDNLTKLYEVFIFTLY